MITIIFYYLGTLYKVEQLKCYQLLLLKIRIIANNVSNKNCII